MRLLVTPEYKLQEKDVLFNCGKLPLHIGEKMKEALEALEEIYISDRIEYSEMVYRYGESILEYLLETKLILISYDNHEFIYVTNRGE